MCEAFVGGKLADLLDLEFASRVEERVGDQSHEICHEVEQILRRAWPACNHNLGLLVT